MIQLLKTLRVALLVLTGMFSSYSLYSQCRIELLPGQKDNGCYPFQVNMRVVLSTLPTGANPVKFDWTFGDGNSNINPVGDSTLTHTYKTFSPDTTKDFRPTALVTVSGSTTPINCTGPIIKVWDKPVARIRFPAKMTQCFLNNSFCFDQQSTESRNKAKLTRFFWDLGDGTIDSGDATGKPLGGCHSYQNPGTYDITLSVVDAKGCQDTRKETAKIKVLEELKIRFRSVGPARGCAPFEVTFENQAADTTNWHVTKFSWDFGDGSPLNTVDWGGGKAVPAADQAKFVKHKYTKPGIYTPIFRVETWEGCVAEFKLMNGVEIFDPRPVIKGKDTVCWSTAKGAGVEFEVDPIPGATLTVFNYDDPPSGPANTLVNSWKGTHQFQSGPKNYNIRFTMIHDVCGRFDTCKILYVGGPQARINIPRPPAPAALETYKNSVFLHKNKPYSMDKFYQILSREICDRTIDYSTYAKSGTTVPVIDSEYCNATVYKTDFFDTSTCDPKVLTGNFDVSTFFVKATGFKTSSYYDSVRTDATWDADAFIQNPASSPIPNANPSFNYTSFINYYDAKKVIVDSIMTATKGGGFTPAQIENMIFMKLYQRKIWPTKFNTISNEFFNPDSFYNRYFNGGNPSRYNSIVGQSFNTDSFLARKKNPSIPESRFNTMRFNEILWTTPGGIAFDQNMHDSDKYSCEYPNMVRFTNNSIKWRYKNIQPDDKWEIGKPNPNPDICLDPNWPWSSDSMLYFWDFADNSALPCTSTHKGIVWRTGSTPVPGTQPWDCSFSTMAAPWHFYRDTVPNDPYKPCYFPRMVVRDTVNKCQDDQTFIIIMDEPYAGYDTNVFCLMNFYIQLNFGNASTAPYKGFKLSGRPSPCSGPLYRYRVDFTETVPGTCGEPPQDFWIVFDRKKADSIARSNNDYVCVYNRHKDKAGNILHDTIWNLQWIPKQPIMAPFPGVDPVSGGIYGLGGTWSWNENDEGCKDIEVVLKNGDCYDTFVYEKYMCISKLTTKISMFDAGAGSNLGDVTTYDPAYNDKSAPPIVYNGITYPAGDFVSPLYDGNAATRLYGTDPKRVCGNQNGESHFIIKAADTTQDFVTRFEVNGFREEMPVGDYYYYRGFWPKKARLDYDPSFRDSINAFKDELYRPRVTPVNYVAVTFWNPTKKIIDTIILSGSFAFLRKAEVDSLNLGFSPLIPVEYNGKIDFRNNYLRAFCDSNGNKNAPLRLVKKGPSTRVLIQDTVRILDLANKDTTDFNDPKKLHAVMKIKLKYPGIYTFQVTSSNLEGCSAPATVYQIINGHYATYQSPDTVSCVNVPVRFFDKVRYFTVDGNIIGRDPRGVYWPGGLWDQVLSADGIFDEDGDFRPWDMDPVQARKNFNSKWNPRFIANPEKIEWDFDGDGTIDQPSNGQVHNPVFSYKEPGIYSPRMYTTDSNGCRLETVLRNYIKIIKVVDTFYTWNDYSSSDTLRVCAPHTFKMIDSSYMHKGRNTYFAGRNKFAFMDTVITNCPPNASNPKPHPCLQPKLVVVDSFIRYTWEQGDGRPAIIRRQLDTVRRFTYTFNDTFTFKHKVETEYLCSDSTIKNDWLVVLGPKPRFVPISPNKGCLPFTVWIKNQRRSKSGSFLFDKHDGTTVTTSPDSEYIAITFDHLKSADSLAGRDSSVYSIDLLMTDSVYNPIIGAKLKCSALWPDTFARPTDTTYYITVYRRDTVNIFADTIFCPNETFIATARSTKMTTYSNFHWYKDSDTAAFKTGTDSTASLSFNTPGWHRLTVKAYHKYCDPLVSYLDIYIDSIMANFTIDSMTMGRLGKFNFSDSSYGNRDAIGGNLISPNEPEWYFDVPLDQDASTWMTANSGSAVKSASPLQYFDYETKLTEEDKRDPEKKEWEFKVCLRVYSKRPCPDDTCKIVKFVRDFKTYNIFTPGNGDGKNDNFNPLVKGEKAYNIMIFNRWGEKVFEGDDANQDWNGKNFNSGADCPAGTYFYIVKYDLLGKKKGVGQRTGTITLVR